ncbi:MAG: 50S ribosomal protein L29 [Pseudomonadota bacterium]
MEASELRNKTVEELNDELVALRREQYSLRMQAATGDLANTGEPSRVRKDIARVKTVLNELKRAAGEQ